MALSNVYTWLLSSRWALHSYCNRKTSMVHSRSLVRPKYGDVLRSFPQWGASCGRRYRWVCQVIPVSNHGDVVHISPHSMACRFPCLSNKATFNEVYPSSKMVAVKFTHDDKSVITINQPNSTLTEWELIWLVQNSALAVMDCNVTCHRRIAFITSYSQYFTSELCWNSLSWYIIVIFIKQ